MDFIAPISRNIIYPLWAIWEGSSYLKYYKELQRTQYESIEKIKERQLDALKNIIKYSVKNIPFWKERFDRAKILPHDVKTMSDLQRLPLLTKADLRQYGKDLISSKYNIDELYRHITSGSIGIPVTTYRDKTCQQYKRGATLRCNEWTGWRRGERVANIWGNPQIRKDWKGKIRRSLLERNYAYLDTIKMSEKDMSKFAEVLLSRPPSMLFGHAHSLYLFANFLELNYPAHCIRPRGILSTCMVLHQYERKQIESTFKTNVTDRYGCEEVSLIACGCEKNEGLHVNAECVYVEILDKKGNTCPPGKLGRVIVTDLRNRAMPLIRYEVGDMSVWAGKPCSCGRTLPLLERVEGRVADYVVTENGSYISGISLTENFAVKVNGVEQMQIIQKKVNKFVLNIVKGVNFDNKSMVQIDSLATHFFGPNVECTCNFMDRIPQEKSGKYRFCISEVVDR